MKTKIYIAGPMSGLPDYNYPTFNLVARELRCLGWDVVNPVEIGERFGPPEKIDSDQITYSNVIAECCDTIRRECTHIYLLPGWEKSRGARYELYIALQKQLPILLAYAPAPR